MSTTEPSEAHDADPLSPTTQRRLWRRAWIGLVVLLVLLPVVLWIAIDQGGKRQWREVQARLRAKGEATTLDELALPQRGEIPDEENFCSLPWLILNRDGTDSPAVEELKNKLKILGASHEDRMLSKKAEGAPWLGFPSDFMARARTMDLIADEENIYVDPVMMETTGDDSLARIVVYMDSLESHWEAAEAALDRRHAYFLPLVEERLEEVEGVMLQMSYPSISIAQGVSKALALRASVAIARGEHETALRSLEVGSRLREAIVNDGNLIGGLVAVTVFAVQIGPVVECLWDKSLQRDAEKLQRLESILESWDLQKILMHSIRSELVFMSDGMQQLSKLRGDIAREYGLGSWSALVPPGWWHANAAYGADLTDRTLLDACRSGRYAELRTAAALMATELDSLNRIEQIFNALVVMSFGSYERIIDSYSYCEALRRQAAIMCSLYRYQIDHDGALPETLDELVPDYMSSVPADPVDGAPMRYTLLTGREETEGRRLEFQLYSIGLDASDDGGFLTLDPEEPLHTRPRPRDSNYLGDWPWPVTPRDAAEFDP